MSLAPGTRLGSYEIVSAVGAGGMGEVYKARDTRLDRAVAIKVLPPHVLDDPGARARFEREARAAAALDHPNICALYDIGRDGGVEYLVLQYLDGETLAARLRRGPLPIAEALRHAAEIAGALDKAHRAGIVHRDIKPGNVMLAKAAGRDTSAMLLDFGLAKSVVLDATGPAGETGVTATSPLTGRGAIVGTMPYMSPEQLEGRELDLRSDIFSFGALLYEMITGRRAFDGVSEASIIGAILERDPPAIESSMAPPALDRVVRRCLAKDRERRWQSAADLADELSWIAHSSGVQHPVRAASRSRAPLYGVSALVSIAALGLAGLGWVLGRDTKAGPPAGVARQLAIVLPDRLLATRGGIAVAPDGRTIVFVGAPAGPTEDTLGGPRQLYVRRFNASEATPIPGTAGARTPFFSPDGQSVGYFTNAAIMKVSLRGGPPARVADCPPVTRGGAWLADDTIVVSPTQTSGLVRVSQDGKSTVLTTVDTARGERAHLWPSLLPGGAHILFTIQRGTTADVDTSDIAVLDVATGERRVVYQGGNFARYSPTGHLLFVRGGTLTAIPFDPVSRTTTGTPVPIAERVAVDFTFGGAHYAVAPDGTVALLRGSFPERRTSGVWVTNGKPSPAAGITGRAPRISPDGARALFDVRSPDGDYEVYVADLVRGSAVRFSSDPQDDFSAIWTPDGRRAIWTALAPGRWPFLVMRATDGSGGIEPVFPAAEVAQFAGSVSPSNVLAYTQADAKGGRDIWVASLDGDRKPRPFLASSAYEFGPEFSPDGNWIAYVSRESGAPDIYVTPYPGPGGTRRVTSGGGTSPAWGRDGATLYYQSGDGLMAVSVTGGSDIQFGAPRTLFRGAYVADSSDDGPRSYDVAPDGKRFLMFVRDVTSVPPPVFQVLIDWVADVKR